LPYFLSATGVTVYIHDFALRLELVMTVNRTRQCGQVLEAQDGNGVPIPTVVPTGAAPIRALQGCVLATMGIIISILRLTSNPNISFKRLLISILKYCFIESNNGRTVLPPIH
jgi:hypothetical protein